MKILCVQVQPKRSRGIMARVLLLIDTNAEWTQVEFQDPELGRRVGYVETKYVRIDGPSRAR